MRLGILGGTFDPVHFGHLLLAELCREQCGLDRVWFLPTGQPPHKRDRALTPAPKRVEMLKLAIAGHPAFEISTIEADRDEVSYTFETLAAIHGQRPDDELFFLMGADALRDMPTWREPATVCELAAPVVVRRRDAPEPDFSVLTHLVSAERLQQIQRVHVEMPVVEFSSTSIRNAVAAGRSIRYQTPRAVEMYIQTQRLYEAAP
jgi:nicotinate-nucleotide adenylyltransferase